MMETLTFKCNALIAGRNPLSVNSVVDHSTKTIGNWIGGTLYLGPDSLTFSTNAINARFQENNSDFVLSYDDIRTCHLGRMMLLFKTVDLETDQGSVRFRCLGDSNNQLLDELATILAAKENNITPNTQP